MKNLSFLIAFMLLGFAINAQVTESMSPMSIGTKNSLSVIVTGLEPKTVEDIWEKFAKKFDGKDKYNRKIKELFIDNATIKTISDNTIDIYSKAEKAGDATQFTVWFDLGGAYLNSQDHPDRYTSGVALMNDFLKETERYKVNNNLKDAEKALSKLEDQKNGMEKDVKGWEKDIQKAEEKIEGWKKDIEKSKNDQQNKQAEIEKQKTEIELIKSDLSKI